MNLYEIDRAFLECIDVETGEIIDFDKMESLGFDLNENIENMALAYKNLKAESEGIKSEIANLQERKKRIDSKTEQLSAKLQTLLSGERFETSKVEIKFRKSSSVEVDDEFINWAIKNDMDCYLRYKTPEVNKALLKEALSHGDTIPHAQLVSKQNISIK